MHYAVSVEEAKCLNNLVESSLKFVQRKRINRPFSSALGRKNLLAISLDVVFEVEVVVLVDNLSQLIPDFRVSNLTDVWVVNALQMRDFPQHTCRESVILASVGYVQEDLS